MLLCWYSGGRKIESNHNFSVSWKNILYIKPLYHRRPQYKIDTSTAIQAGEVNPVEDVYEEPDFKTPAAAVGKFKLTECPAYEATTNTLKLYATTEAQLQSGYYEF